ncbi:MAG: peptidylprolyl isomerase [Bacteroidetes bacterium]|nr:MAG: peptidylprolyl isomerase [Bacteroidota bacterium]
MSMCVFLWFVRCIVLSFQFVCQIVLSLTFAVLKKLWVTIMSIIQQIRDKYAAVVIGLIALSLIGFILMDSGKGGSGGVNMSDAVGSINGTNISYETYSAATKSREDMYLANGQRVDDNTRQQIYSDTWRMMVESELLSQEYKKLGLSVTDKEFNDLMFGKKPAQFLVQEFTDPNTGEFDAAKAKTAIAEIKKQKNNPNTERINEFYLKPLLENRLRSKYNELLSVSAYVPNWLAEKSVAESNAIASFSFVTVPFSSIPDSSVEVTDAKVSAYISARAAQFKQEEGTRSLAYVSFPFNPSASDSADARDAVSRLAAEFATTDDAGAFVTRNGSSISFFDGYNSKGRIQIAQKDSIIGAGLGKVYGPYLDGGNYVLSRVVDVKQQPDSVKARHILIGTMDPRTQQPIRDDSTAKALADSVERVIKGGGSFELLALQKSDDEGSKIKGGDLGYFVSGTMVKEFNDFCFGKKAGESGIVKTQFGYHYIQITDQKNFETAYKIAYLSKPIEASQETVNDAQGKANAFAAKARTLKAFDEVVKKDSLTKLLATDVKESDFQISGLGVNRKVVRDIYEASVGKVLDAEEFGNQFVVIAVTGSEKPGLMSVAKARPQVENLIRNEEKTKLLITKIGAVSSLEAVATAQKTTVMRADSVLFGSPTIPNVGYELKVGGFAFNKAMLNKVSPVIGGTSGVFVIKSDFIGAKSDASASVEETRKTLEGQQKGSATYASMQALRNAAVIKDKRSKFQ